MKEYTTEQLKAEIEKRQSEEEQNKFKIKPIINHKYYESYLMNLNNDHRNLYQVHIDDGGEGFYFLIHFSKSYEEDEVQKICLHYHLTSCEELGIYNDDIHIEDVNCQQITWGQPTYINVEK